MSTHKYIDQICVAVLAVTLIITILFMNGEALGIEKIVDWDSENYSGSVYFTANDEKTDLYGSSATVITLKGSEASVSGPGAYAYDGGVVIKNAGIYTVSGTLTDGSIVVDAGASAKVFILLKNVDVTSMSSAAFLVRRADKVFLTLADGSENVFTTLETGAGEAQSVETDGAVFSHDDLTINGSGSLTVTAGLLHGISVNDDLVITGGTIRVTAPADGIRANDSIRIKNADITVTAGDDGLIANAEGAYLYVLSGNLTIDAAADAVQASGAVTVDGGSFSVRSGDDGIHSDTAITVNGGELTLINDSLSDADGLDSNGNISVTGGSIRISLPGSGANTAIDCDGSLQISGGDIIACGSFTTARGFDAGSAQPSILCTVKDGADAGSVFSVADADGNVLISWELPLRCSSVNVSCPGLTLGAAYAVSCGGDTCTVTLEETANSIFFNNDTAI